jgi:hypothetical protein
MGAKAMKKADKRKSAGRSTRARRGKKMSTLDVPGANPANADELRAGCWAEAPDGSMLYVKGTENDQVIYELYDLATDPVVYYQDAMRREDFEKAFSRPPTGTASDDWTWRDKSPMPWSKVMKTFDRPRPQHADVVDTLSAAARVAQSLRLRAQRLHPETVAPRAETEAPRPARSILERIQRALDVLFKE